MQKQYVEYTMRNIELNKIKRKRMKRNNSIKFIGVLFVLTALFMSNENANAQSEWLDYGSGNSISIEIDKPFIAQDSLGGSLNPGLVVYRRQST